MCTHVGACHGVYEDIYQRQLMGVSSLHLPCGSWRQSSSCRLGDMCSCLLRYLNGPFYMLATNLYKYSASHTQHFSGPWSTGIQLLCWRIIYIKRPDQACAGFQWIFSKKRCTLDEKVKDRG